MVRDCLINGVHFEIDNPWFSVKEFEFIRSELVSLCQNGAIKKVNDKPYCVSPLKCVPKKNGQLRLVTNMPFFKFQYENVDSVSQLVESDDHMITFDLNNGFFHYLIDKVFRQYLGFKFDGQYYVWCVCPFDWSSSPYYFHKLLRPVTTFLSENNIRNILHVNDCIVIARLSRITVHKDFTLRTFEDLGFIVNYEKSALDSDTRREYQFIEYIFDSHGPDGNPWVYMTSEKIHLWAIPW